MDRPQSKRKGDFGDAGSRKTAKMDGGNGASKGKMSLAEKMMAKMGYKSGQGLGASGEGILNPIEVKLRPQGAGVGAVSEKTQQAKSEERRAAERRGEKYEDSEDEERKSKQRRKEAIRSATGQDREGTPKGFTRPSKPKYRTAAEIEASAEGLVIPNVLKSIIDATGKEPKLLTSAAGLMSSVPTTPSAQTDEEKLAGEARREVESIVNEWNQNSAEKKALEEEEEDLEKELEMEETKIMKIEAIMEAIQGLEVTDHILPDDLPSQWERVASGLETLQVEYQDDIEEFDLSTTAVAAIAPLLQQETATWSPLDKPNHMVSYIRRLRPILGIKVSKDDEVVSNGYHGTNRSNNSKNATMYESLIHTAWLPTIRAAVTNEWDPHSPSALISLIEEWKDLLPNFIYYSIMETLIITKLSAAVQAWNPRTASKAASSSKDKHKSIDNSGAPLPHVWLFPWFPLLSSQHTDPKSSHGLLADVKRKLKVVLDTWDLSLGVFPGLSAWREVLRSELDKALIKHLLPRLALHLSTDFEVFPPDQDLSPLEHVLAWQDYFKPTVMAQLLVAEFFPKFFDTLHGWLTSEDVSYEEVGQWFTWWKAQMPSSLKDVSAMEEQWDKALQMMNLALDLGDRAKDELPKPSVAGAELAEASAGTPLRPGTPLAAAAKETPKKELAKETTFRDVVEEWCAEESLLLIPLREAHETTGLPLFRITASATGRGGAVVFLKGDVVWAQDKKDRSRWEPIGLEEKLVQKAEGK
ncbi:G-patch domain-containing protein [Rhizodiscina lignyota]|uniref:G-patch domain-containing protein n=1 Tax=Rhizodiscina lignyota TaxID=1504668 RepID=A0A9P4ILH8_9PEZI|nr:G-patch domain-containing protein [Rhizodiscina lignyota]